MIDFFTEQLLGAHVFRRANHESRLRQRFFTGPNGLRNSEINDLAAIAAIVGFRDNDVVRLEVAMHDAESVCRIQAIGDLSDERRHARQRQRSVFQQHLLERPPSDELHGKVHHAVGRLAEVEDVSHPIVIDAAGVRGFTTESCHRRWILHHVRMQELDRGLTR